MASEARTRSFVGRFVRPHGLDVPATPRFVEALESLAGAPAREPARFGVLPARLAAAAAAAVFHVPVLRIAFMSRQDTEDEAASRERAQRDAAAKSVVLADVQARVEAKTRVRLTSIEQKQHVRIEKQRDKRMRVMGQQWRKGVAWVKTCVKQVTGMRRA